jgi:phage terminase large subunit-like protein
VTITLTPLERAILQKTAERFQPPKLSPYLMDPAGFVTNELDEHLWSKQCDIAASVVAHRRTAVRSCHSAGKSFLASRIAAWWIATHPAGEAFVASTAPSYPQVHAILWEEIRKAARKSDAIPGRVLQSDEWKLDDGTLVGWGRKPADTDEHGFHGIHRRYVLVILDEACGIPAQLWTAVEAITTNADCRILAIGNPDDPNTEFASVCKPGSGWNVIEINGLTTPNMTPEAVAAYPQLAALFADLGLEPTTEPVPDELRPLMLDPEWVVDKIRRWGVNSPRFTSKVLGRFPDIGVDTLISPSLIEAAQQRHLEASGRAILGVDVARYGADSTVIYVRRGPVIRLHGEYAKQATTETTGRVIAAKAETGADEIRVDGVGVGGGVVDQLTEQGYGALDMQAGAAARDKDRFANARAEWAWAMRERLESGDVDLDPADDDLAAQLGALKYKYNSRGQIVIESKDDMRKRGLPSPDHADAAILTAIAPAGADLFPRLPWRVWSWAPDTGVGPAVSCAGRPWPLASMRLFITASIAENPDTDFTVTSMWGRTLDGALVLIDRERRRDGEPLDGPRALLGRWAADTVYVTKQDHAGLLKAGYGAHRLHLSVLDVDQDPHTRALPASAAVIGGKVWLPAVADWREQWLAEHLAFPHSRHQGSVTTLALAVFATATRWIPPPQQPADPRPSIDGPDFMSMTI